MSEDDARAAEAAGNHVVVEWRGFTFKVPTDYDDWSVDLVESIEEGKEVGIVRGALGPEQWALVKAQSPKVRDLRELGRKIAGALGFGSLGESAPSGD